MTDLTFTTLLESAKAIQKTAHERGWLCAEYWDQVVKDAEIKSKGTNDDQK
jgi:hypothetical protein